MEESSAVSSGSTVAPGVALAGSESRPEAGSEAGAGLVTMPAEAVSPGTCPGSESAVLRGPGGPGEVEAAGGGLRGAVLAALGLRAASAARDSAVSGPCPPRGSSQ